MNLEDLTQNILSLNINKDEVDAIQILMLLISSP